MTALDRMKRRLRDRSEHYLMLDSVRRLGAGSPGTSKPYRESGGVLWRLLFVPVYRRLPWSLKQAAMQRLRMTAQGWTPPPLKPSDPWKPPERR